MPTLFSRRQSILRLRPVEPSRGAELLVLDSRDCNSKTHHVLLRTTQFQIMIYADQHHYVAHLDTKLLGSSALGPELHTLRTLVDFLVLLLLVYFLLPARGTTSMLKKNISFCSRYYSHERCEGRVCRHVLLVL